MAEQIIKGANSEVHYVPGEHDWLDGGQAFKARHGQGTKGDGWYSFDSQGVHFVALVNVVDFKAGSLTSLGQDQIAWLKDDVSGLASSTPIVVFTHIPLWAIYPKWGWGTEDSAQALQPPEALRLGHGAERPHPPGAPEGRGQCHLPYGDVDGLSAARTGRCSGARPPEGASRQATQLSGRAGGQLCPGSPAARNRRQTAIGLNPICP
jgi:hypothetical protein